MSNTPQTEISPMARKYSVVAVAALMTSLSQAAVSAPPPPDIPAAYAMITPSHPPRPDVVPQERNLITGKNAESAPANQSVRPMQPSPKNLLVHDASRRQGLANQQSSGDRANDTAKTPKPAPKKTVKVNKGWLSDGLDHLLKSAGFQRMIWGLTNDAGKPLDFEIHQSFKMTVSEHLEAVYQLTEHYPIRLCLYEADKVVKVIDERSSCQ